MEVVSSEIQRFAQKHEERLHHHENVEALQLLDNRAQCADCRGKNLLR